MNTSTLLQSGVKTGFRLLERISPALGQQLVARTFFRPLKFKRPMREQAWLDKAKTRQAPFANHYPHSSAESYYRVYEWGNGPAVLLVHGWAGRGLQLGGLALALAEAGYQAVTFDAPAHGDSPGKQTNLMEFGDVIADLSKQYDGFESIIGHSFGGIAAAFALSEGVQTDKLVTIGSPASMDFIFTQFATQIGVSLSSTATLAAQIEKLGKRPIDQFSLSYLIKQIDLPGLIIHDQQDREVTYEQALTLKDHWPRANFVATDGLGHHRILRDSMVIATICDFMALESNQPHPANTQPVVID